MKVFVVIEEDIDGAKVVYVGNKRALAEKHVYENYANELRFLMDGVYRCGSSVISIQEADLDS